MVFMAFVHTGQTYSTRQLVFFSASQTSVQRLSVHISLQQEGSIKTYSLHVSTEGLQTKE